MAKVRTRILKMFILGFKQFRDPYYQGFAAQVSFYLTLSIVPILLLITQILGIFNISLERALGLIEEYTGTEMSSMFQGLFEFSSVGFGNIVFVFIALWAASRASFSLMRITNYTLTSGESTGKGYFRDRFRAMRTMIMTIITIVFALIIMANGRLIVSLILGLIGMEEMMESMDMLWLGLRWPVGFIMYLLMVSYNYYILPSEKVEYRKVLPGSLFASIGMLIVTFVYSGYTNSLANYDVLYGALSSVVAIMLWFYFIAWVIFLGVLCNKVWDDTSSTSGKTDPPEHLKFNREEIKKIHDSTNRNS